MRVRQGWKKAREAWVMLRDYIRYDFKEIAFPSHLPWPPGMGPPPKPRRRSFREHVEVWKEACRQYRQTWRSGDDDELDEDLHGDGGRKKRASPELSAMEELALAARAGSENIKPALQRIYMTRASAYRDALKCFIQAYQEGLAEEMSSKDSSSSHETDDGKSKPKARRDFKDSHHEK